VEPQRTKKTVFWLLLGIAVVAVTMTFDVH